MSNVEVLPEESDVQFIRKGIMQLIADARKIEERFRADVNDPAANTPVGVAIEQLAKAVEENNIEELERLADVLYSYGGSVISTYIEILKAEQAAKGQA